MFWVRSQEYIDLQQERINSVAPYLVLNRELTQNEDGDLVEEYRKDPVMYAEIQRMIQQQTGILIRNVPCPLCLQSSLEYCVMPGDPITIWGYCPSENCVGWLE